MCLCSCLFVEEQLRKTMHCGIGCVTCENLCEKADRYVHVFISVGVCVYNKNAFHMSVNFGFTQFLLT